MRAEDDVGIGEAGILFLHLRAEIAEDLERIAHDLGDLGVDLGVAEVRRVGDAKIGHAFVEAEPPVAPVVRQRVPVARIG